ncbi:MAG: TonB-dependent receptor [Proteobacteria bacterium]|nr:MAG: TonB-dependent receptor [Pseudomonadota bacterium]
MTKINHTSALLLSTALGAMVSGPLFAADGAMLEEVTVTATKMGETNLQETPLAISAFTSDYLDKTGSRDVRDLVFGTPNLIIAQNGNSAQIYIRGVGSNNSFLGGETSSTVHLDGVYIARPGAVFFNFLDVERIEVLRGPQGTLYGRNSVGGTINVISRKPDNQLHAKVQGTIGNFDLWRAEGYISGPIVEDKVTASVSAMRSKRDGYFKNVVATSNDRGSEDTWSVRGQVRVTPNEKLELLVRADYLKDEGLPAGNQALLLPFFPVAGGPENPATAAIFGDWHKFAADTPSTFDKHLAGVSGELTYEFSEAAILKSLTAYRESKTEAFSDTDATDLNRQTTGLSEKQHQFSQEFNLSGRIDRAKYVLGLYYFDESVSSDGPGVHAIPAGFKTQPHPSVDTEALAAYGQVDYDLTEQLTVTAGIRYSDEKKHFVQNLNRELVPSGLSAPGFPVQYVRDGKYTAWTPKVGLQFKPNEDVMLFVSATRGFKSGGFNFSSGNTVHGYGPEKLWSYEAGFKSDFADKRVRLNGTAFYYDYKDLQVQAFITPGVTDITNASDAKIQGFELELLTRPVDGLDLGASLNHLDATYKNFPAAPITGGTFDASGKRLNSAPKWSYNLFAQYTHDLGDMGSLSLRGEYAWKGRQFFTVVNDNIQTSPSYELVNASISYTSPDERWQVILYGRNLTNDQYLISAGGFTAVPSGTPGDPRTYGLRLAFTY